MSLWQCGIVAEHAGHQLQLTSDVTLLCNDCKMVVADLSDIGMEAAYTALEFDLQLENKYRAHYVHCRKFWMVDRHVIVGDRCPSCSTLGVQPFMVRNLDEDVLSLLIPPEFIPFGGWPEGIAGIIDLCWAELPATVC